MGCMRDRERGTGAGHPYKNDAGSGAATVCADTKPRPHSCAQRCLVLMSCLVGLKVFRCAQLGDLSRHHFGEEWLHM